eukprot:INCI2684.2.p2 GENE.INCI2684.2~~INCI2684.2.p2  ORF type:complete len:278 (+),score=60.91 INCI2684.2:227-1060(+)
MGIIDRVVNYEQTIRNYGSAVTVGVFIGSAITTGCAFGVATYWFASKNVIGVLMSQIKGQVKYLKPLLLPGGARQGSNLQQQQQHEGDDGVADDNVHLAAAAAATTTVAPGTRGGAAHASSKAIQPDSKTANAKELRALTARLAELESKVRGLERRALLAEENQLHLLDSARADGDEPRLDDSGDRVLQEPGSEDGRQIREEKELSEAVQEAARNSAGRLTLGLVLVGVAIFGFVMSGRAPSESDGVQKGQKSAKKLGRSERSPAADAYESFERFSD